MQDHPVAVSPFVLIIASRSFRDEVGLCLWRHGTGADGFAVNNHIYTKHVRAESSHGSVTPGLQLWFDINLSLIHSNSSVAICT